MRRALILLLSVLLVMTGGVMATGGEVTVSQTTLDVGESATVTHVVSDDNSTRDVTNESTITVSDSDVLRLNGSEITGESEGSSTVIATWEDSSGQEHTHTETVIVEQTPLTTGLLVLIVGSIAMILFMTPRSLGGTVLLAVQVFMSGGLALGAVGEQSWIAGTIAILLLSAMVSVR